MNQDYIERMSAMTKKMQEPLQALADLNLKTMQRFAVVKPEPFIPKKPQDVLEKQLELVIENGHNALDYMQKSFQIIEKTMRSFIDITKETNEQKSPH